jgi:hypothetical protein
MSNYWTQTQVDAMHQQGMANLAASGNTLGSGLMGGQSSSQTGHGTFAMQPQAQPPIPKGTPRAVCFSLDTAYFTDLLKAYKLIAARITTSHAECIVSCIRQGVTTTAESTVYCTMVDVPTLPDTVAVAHITFPLDWFGAVVLANGWPGSPLGLSGVGTAMTLDYYTEDEVGSVCGGSAFIAPVTPVPLSRAKYDSEQLQDRQRDHAADAVSAMQTQVGPGTHIATNPYATPLTAPTGGTGLSQMWKNLTGS